MKKNLLYTLAALFCMAAAMVSCSSDDEITNPTEPEKARTITVNLIPETETRTMLDADAKLRWQTGDEVSYFTSADGNDWSVSTKAEINASTGSFTATIPAGASQIRVVYPAVENGKEFSEDLYAVKKYQNYAVKELAEGEFFFDGKYLPMYTLPTTIAEGAQEVKATYKVNGAVVKMHLTYNENAKNYFNLKAVKLGEYQFGFPKGTYTIKNDGSCDACVVLPIGQTIDYTPLVTGHRVADSYGTYVYQNYNYKYPSAKSGYFYPQAHTMNFDFSSIKEIRNWGISFGEDYNTIPTDNCDNYFNLGNGTFSGGSNFYIESYNGAWYQLALANGQKATYKVKNTQATAYKVDVKYKGYDGGTFTSTLKKDGEIVTVEKAYPAGSDSWTAERTTTLFIMDVLPEGDYTFEIEDTPGNGITLIDFQPLTPTRITLPTTSSIMLYTLPYWTEMDVVAEQMTARSAKSVARIPLTKTDSYDYTVAFQACAQTDGVQVTASLVKDFQTVKEEVIDIANTNPTRNDYSFHTGTLEPGNYTLVFKFSGWTSVANVNITK